MSAKASGIKAVKAGPLLNMGYWSWDLQNSTNWSLVRLKKHLKTWFWPSLNCRKCDCKVLEGRHSPRLFLKEKGVIVDKLLVSFEFNLKTRSSRKW